MTKVDVSNLTAEKRAAIEARRAYQREPRQDQSHRGALLDKKSDVSKHRERRKQGIKKHRLTCTTTSDGKEQPHQLRIEKVKLRCNYTTNPAEFQPEQEKILSITEKLVELIPTGRANAALNGVIKYLQSFAVPEDTQYD